MKSKSPESLIAEIHEMRGKILEEISHSVVGQKKTLDLLLIALLSGGHCLLHGVPGLAKTLIVHSLAKVLDISFSRIQFTPDLMPTDITGTEVMENRGEQRIFKFYKGPIFANIVLADEINRTPPKTQAALLQAMQESVVTLYGKTYPLDFPFFVLATENPIEQEGTYRLPEAQLDRFLFTIKLHYPDFEEEMQIATKKTFFNEQKLNKVIGQEEIKQYQDFIEDVPISDKMIEYVVKIVTHTRPEQPNASLFVKENIAYGAGPRASQNIVIAAKANAALQGNYSVTKEDIKKVAYPILEHRVILNFSAISAKVTTNEIITQVIHSAES